MFFSSNAKRNKMWQKCPVCNGSGVAGFALYTAPGLCGTCNGHGIISELSGAPPPLSPKTMTTNTTQAPRFPKISEEQKKAEIADILKRTKDFVPSQSLPPKSKP
jgi:hypothetical protein